MRISSSARVAVLVVLVFVCCATVLCQDAAKPVTNQDVIEMTKAGLSPEIITAKIKAGPTKFDTSTQGLADLKAAGVSDAVIVAILNPPASVAPDAKPTSEFAYLKVYRHRRYMGSALAPSIYVDQKQITRIGNGRRACIRLTPGKHTIGSDDKSSAITVEMLAGKEYYIRVDEETGFWKGHGRLTLLAAEQGSPEYNQAKPVEEDRRIAKDMLEPDPETTNAEKKTDKPAKAGE
ncbi:MAG TPA: DUF2846 domain-containing protein [Terriglobales bacterium]